MAINETDTDTPIETDTSVWGAGTQEGEIPLRDAVVASQGNLTVDLSAVVDGLFSKISADGQVQNSTYLRALQILYLYDLHSIALSYWPEAEKTMSSILNSIEGTASVRSLEKDHGYFLDLAARMRSLLSNTTIDKRTIELVKSEAAPHGDMAPILETILFYFVALGVSNSGGASL